MGLHQHGSKARAGSCGSIDTKMFVIVAAGLDLPAVTMGVGASQLLVVIVFVRRDVDVGTAAVVIASQRTPKRFHLVQIKRFDLLRRIVGLVLRRDHLKPKPMAAEVEFTE